MFLQSEHFRVGSGLGGVWRAKQGPILFPALLDWVYCIPMNLSHKVIYTAWRTLQSKAVILKGDTSSQCACSSQENVISTRGHPA